MKLALLATLLLTLSGCMTTRVVFSDKFDPRAKPAYVDYFDYYWLGFRGEREVALQKVCMDQRPHAIVRTKTAEDVLLTYITVGIYSPVTVKIWCGE